MIFVQCILFQASKKTRGCLSYACQASDAPALDAKANKYAAIWLQKKNRIKESMLKSSTEKRCGYSHE